MRPLGCAKRNGKMTEEQSEEAKWLNENPPEELYFRCSVEKREDLPDDPAAWNAVWVKELDDLLVFAFGRWLPFSEVVAKETIILKENSLALAEELKRGKTINE